MLHVVKQMNTATRWVEKSLDEMRELRKTPIPPVDLAKRQQDIEIATQAAEMALATLNSSQTPGRVLTEAEQTLVWALRTLRGDVT